ncbi:EG45-like domain containing protein [Tanacetum coccineum]
MSQIGCSCPLLVMQLFFTPPYSRSVKYLLIKCSFILRRLVLSLDCLICSIVMLWLFEAVVICSLAANSGLFANRAACGTRYRVTCTSGTNLGVPQPCTGNSVDVTVVDLCPGCASNQLNLSQEAFAVIANRDAGRINIEYNRTCARNEKLMVNADGQSGELPIHVGPNL